MAAQQSSRTGAGTIEQEVVDLVRECGELAPDEIVVHVELLACTRRMVAGRERIERRRWSTAGADPHTSYGILHAEAVKIRTQELT